MFAVLVWPFGQPRLWMSECFRQEHPVSAAEIDNAMTRNDSKWRQLDEAIRTGDVGQLSGYGVIERDDDVWSITEIISAIDPAQGLPVAGVHGVRAGPSALTSKLRADGVQAAAQVVVGRRCARRRPMGDLRQRRRSSMSSGEWRLPDAAVRGLLERVEPCRPRGGGAAAAATTMTTRSIGGRQSAGRMPTERAEGATGQGGPEEQDGGWRSWDARE